MRISVAQGISTFIASYYEYVEGTTQLPWTRTAPPTELTDFLPHPTDEDGLIASGTVGVTTNLFYSSNFGLNWRQIRANVYSYHWAAAGKYGLPANRLFVHENGDPSGARHDWWINRIVYTTDLFATPPQTVYTGLTQFIAVDDDLFLLRPRSESGDYDSDLFVSSNGGSQWSQVTLPFSSNRQQVAFTILDGEDASIFINVAHENFVWGNVYAADAFTDKLFRLSLTRVPRRASGSVEFSRIRGLHGFYMANQYIQETEDETEPVRTLISFDEGAEWHPLRVPDSLTHLCNDEDVCQLNLLGPSARISRTRGAFFSRPSAIGIVVGLGNVGPFLSHNVSELDMFISRDGGKSFHLLHRGTRIYEIVNHGSLVIMIPDSGLTNVLSFTDDEGAHTTECDFLSGTGLGPVIIDSLVVDPDGSLPYALIEAHQTTPGGRTKTFIIHLDFTRAQDYICGGYDRPDAPDSDYEVWNPSDYSGSTCILGRRLAYERKKPDRDCMNAVVYQPIATNQSCPCRLADYECADCFEKDFASGKCMIKDVCTGVVNPFVAPENCTGYWTRSSGHVLLPGDYCSLSTGLDLRPREVVCPPASSLPPGAADPPIDKPDIRPLNPPAAPPPVYTAPVARAPINPPVAAPKEAPKPPVAAPVRAPVAPQRPPVSPPPKASPVAAPVAPPAFVPLAAPVETPMDPAPAYVSPPTHRHPPPALPPRSSNSTSPDGESNLGPAQHSAALAPAIIVIASLASLLLLVLVTGGLLWGLSGRHSGIRRFMMRFFSEASLPAFAHGDSENGYHALSLVDMNEDGVWDPELLEEDADLIDDR